MKVALVIIDYPVLLAVSTSWANDPEEYMDVPEIIRYWGYPAEVVEATTTDGYILDLHRIPWSKNGGNDGKQKPVVFLQHGLECSSSNWVTNLPNESAAFMFSDAGFDVWMGNMRGNTYGKNHKTLDPNSREFWQFSWDEMVKYDLDALINTVLNATGQPYLYYIGHSQGTLTMFSKLSLDPDFHNKTRIQIYLTHTPAGTSTQNILHWAQMVLSGQVEMYDYQNTKDNQNHYGQAKPPLYDFTKINSNIYLYRSPPDWLATEKDIEEFLLPTLNPSIIKADNNLSDFNHLDFIWGMRAAPEIYLPIIDIIKKDLNIGTGGR